MEKLINMCWYVDANDNVRICIIQDKNTISINADSMFDVIGILHSFPSEQIDGASVFYDQDGEHFKLEWHK